MNKIVLALLLISGFAKAQTAAPIQAFLGVKFGLSSGEAVNVMSAAKATYLDTKSKKGNFVFRDATFGKFKSDYTYLKFSDDKFFEGGMFFNSDRERAMKLYTEVRHAVATSYGEGTEKRSFTGDYREGDGREAEAIANGSGSMVTTWIEDPANGKRNTIELSIEQDYSIVLKFTEDKASRKK